MIRNILVLFLFVIFSAGLAAQNFSEPIAGELLVRLEPGTVLKDFLFTFNRDHSSSTPDLFSKRQLGNHNIYLLGFESQKRDRNSLLEQLKSYPEVQAVQFNYLVSPRNTPNDLFYDLQWGLDRIGAPEAWELTTGGLTVAGDTIVVAVVDRGFDISHPDFSGNIWNNKGEIPGDGIDNDDNDRIDDVTGWNFVEDRPEYIENSHGQGVAGIIGAKGNNNIGVCGVNWNVKLMLLQIGTVDQIISAYEYVIEQRKKYNDSNGTEGAFVVATNASFGQEKKFCEEHAVWGGMYDLLGEAGVLTAAGTANKSWDVEEVGDMPTTCTSDFIVTVLNMASNDSKYNTSAYGAVSIDMGAPGHQSYSLSLNNGYDEFGGNSAAAPHLSGAIALLYSLPCPEFAREALTKPKETALFMRQILLAGVDPIPSLEEQTVTGGRLNVSKSMALLQNRCGIVITGDLKMKLFPNPTNDILNIEIQIPDFDPYQLQIYNSIGQIVFNKNILPSAFLPNDQELDVGYLAAGVYFVTLSGGQDRISRAFVKR